MAGFYVLEGLDGVGKTTVGKKLAKKLDGVYLTTSVSREEKEKLRDATADEKYALYMDNNREMAEEAIKKVNRGTTVILDRYLASTVAYRNVDAEDKDYMDTIADAGESWIVSTNGDNWLLPKPTATVYLRDDHGYREQWKEDFDYEESDTEFINQVAEQYNRLVDELRMTEVTVVEGEERMVEKVLEAIGDVDG